jgi:hypothetical protein
MNFIRTQFLVSRFFVFIAVVALALSAAGAASADSTTKHITFDHEVVIAGTTLPAGDYTLLVDSGRLTVKRENKVVAQTDAHWEARDDTPDRSSVLYGDGYQVIEIRFAHQRDVLIVAAP